MPKPMCHFEKLCRAVLEAHAALDKAHALAECRRGATAFQREVSDAAELDLAEATWKLQDVEVRLAKLSGDPYAESLQAIVDDYEAERAESAAADAAVASAA